jgi:hypothetical protein
MKKIIVPVIAIMSLMAMSFTKSNQQDERKLQKVVKKNFNNEILGARTILSYGTQIVGQNMEYMQFIVIVAPENQINSKFDAVLAKY